jgi:hypothetical protein
MMKKRYGTYKVKSRWRGFAVVEDEKGDCGIVGADMAVIIPLTYGYIDCFDNDGVAFASLDGCEASYYIFLGADGVVISPERFELRERFDKKTGLARASKRLTDEGKWLVGAVNKKGEAVIPFEYEGMYDFTDGCAVATKDGKCGIIDTAGRPLVPFIYDHLHPYENGVFVAEKQEKRGVIDKNGNIIAPFVYSNIYEYRSGLAPAEKDGKWGAIDEQGQAAIPFLYDDVRTFSGNGNTTMAAIGDKYGWLDRQGKVVVPFEYEWVRSVNGLILAIKNGKYGYLDFDGREVVPFIYDRIMVDAGDMFSNGVKWLGGDKHCFTDGAGNVVEFEYSYRH